MITSLPILPDQLGLKSFFVLWSRFNPFECFASKLSTFTITFTFKVTHEFTFTFTF